MALKAQLELGVGRFKQGWADAVSVARKGVGETTDVMVRGAKAGVKAWAGLSMTIGVKAVHDAARFERQMANVNTLLTGESRKAFGMLKKQVQALDPQLGTTQGLVDGLYQSLSAGVEPAKAVQFVGTAAKLAKAGLADTGTTITALTKAMTAYGKTADDAAGISDGFFKAVQLGQTTIPELAQALPRVTTSAGKLGVPMGELLGITSRLTQVLPNTNEAMTGLKQAFTAIEKPGQEALKYSKQIGVELGENAIKNAGGFVAYMQDVAKKTAGKEGAIAKLFGGVEGKNAVDALLADLPKVQDMAKQTTDAILQNGKITDEAFTKQMQTVLGKADSAMAAIERISIQIGEEFLPPVADGLEKISKHMDLIKEGAEILLIPFRKLKELGEGIGKVAAVPMAMSKAYEREGMTGVAKVTGRVAQDVAQSDAGVRTREALGNAPAAVARGFLSSLPFSNLFFANGGRIPGFPNGGSTNGVNAAPGAQDRHIGVFAPGEFVLNKRTVDRMGPSMLGAFNAGGPAPDGSGVMAADEAGVGFEERLANYRALIAKAFHQGAEDGSKSGTQAGVGSDKQPNTTAGMIFSGSNSALTKAIMQGAKDGDVKGAVQGFAKGLGAQVFNQVKSALVSALGKKLLGGIFGGGFGGFFADGGRPPVGKVSIVGERGPEPFIPDRPGTILPTEALAALGGGRQPLFGEVHVHLTPDQAGNEQAALDFLDTLGMLVERGEAPRFAQQVVLAGSS